jgi:hypothetical protein
MTKERGEHNVHGGKLIPIEKGKTGNPNGRPKGARSKAKLASEVIEYYFHSVFKKHPKYEELIEVFPNIANNATCEEVIYLIQMHKAIFKEDTNAAMFIINRARGTKPEGAKDESNALELPSETVTKIIQENLSKKF